MVTPCLPDLSINHVVSACVPLCGDVLKTLEMRSACFPVSALERDHNFEDSDIHSTDFTPL